MNDNAQTIEPSWICDECGKHFSRTEGTPFHEQDQFGICHPCNAKQPSFDHAFENALGAFWDTLARFYPDIPGDEPWAGPLSTASFDLQAKAAAKVWLANNHPDYSVDAFYAGEMPPAPKSKKPVMPAALHGLRTAVEQNPLMPADFDHHSDERQFDEDRSAAEEDIANEADQLLSLYADAPVQTEWKDD